MSCQFACICSFKRVTVQPQAKLNISHCAAFKYSQILLLPRCNCSMSFKDFFLLFGWFFFSTFNRSVISLKFCVIIPIRNKIKSKLTPFKRNVKKWKKHIFSNIRSVCQVFPVFRIHAGSKTNPDPYQAFYHNVHSDLDPRSQMNADPDPNEAFLSHSKINFQNFALL